MYAAGQTDEVKGTGVWKSFQLKRDSSDDDEDTDGDSKDGSKDE